MGVGPRAAVVVRLGVDDLVELERRGGGVEVDEPVALDLAIERGEAPPEAGRAEWIRTVGRGPPTRGVQARGQAPQIEGETGTIEPVESRRQLGGSHGSSSSSTAIQPSSVIRAGTVSMGAAAGMRSASPVRRSNRPP